MSEIYLSGEPCPICKKDWWDESCEHTWIDVNREFDTLRTRLIELQTDKVELIAQRDTWIGNADALRIELVEALALVYNYDNPSGFAVAQVCDDILDRTGALLGKVRDRARAMKRSD